MGVMKFSGRGGNGQGAARCQVQKKRIILHRKVDLVHSRGKKRQFSFICYILIIFICNCIMKFVNKSSFPEE